MRIISMDRQEDPYSFNIDATLRLPFLLVGFVLAQTMFSSRW
jgi:hypothetical protein